MNWSTTSMVSSGSNCWGSSGRDIWATGGLIGNTRHYDGTSWTSADTAFDDVVNDIWGTGADDVWVVTQEGQLFHYDGTTWEVDRLLGIQAGSAFWGTAPDDVFLVGYAGNVFHFDGIDWAPISVPGADDYTAVWGARSSMIVVGQAAGGGTGVANRMLRHTRWACRDTEQACGDAIDDDCDELVDDDDPDCHGLIVLDEVHGGASDYVEVRNTGDDTVGLTGLTLEWSLGCATGRYMFRADAILGPDEPLRVGADRSPEPHERHSTLMCDAPTAAGWALLCSGTCDVVTCNNVLDFVEKSGTGSSMPPPLCASMNGGPVATTGATATQSVTRVGYTSSGPKPDTADWALGPMTRD